MNKDVKSKWIAELRSGRYVQGMARLRTSYAASEDKFCCLGVLCEIAVAEGVIPAPTKTDAGVYFYAEDGSVALPSVVANWAGIDSIFGTRPNGGDLAQENDHGTPFTQIADIIEEEF